MTECVQALALEIERHLAGGIVVGPEILHFCASTFSIESPAELGALLAAPDDSDAQSLLELLFTPDEAVRVDLETVLEKQCCSAADQGRLVNALSRHDLVVPIKFPSQADALFFSPTKDLLETYVHGLNITRRLPKPLIAAIDQKLAGREGAQIKAVLRHSPLELTDPISTFFVRLVERSKRSGKSIQADLELCLAIFAEQAPDEHLFDLFMAKKRRWLHQLQLAARFEKQLAADNMETLMLRGIRIPHIDQEETRHAIARIDDICMTVFEITDPQPQIPTDVNLGTFSDRDDLDTAFRILS